MPARVDSNDDRAHRRRKDKDKDKDKDLEPYERDSTGSRDKHGRSYKSSSTTKLHRRRSSSRERERESPRSSVGTRKTKKVAMVAPEMDRRPSAPTSETARPKTSYPGFSKAHSREAVGSREDIAKVPPTQDSAELSMQEQKKKRRNSTPAVANGMPNRAPPSPPLAANAPDIRRSASGTSMYEAAQSVKKDLDLGRKSMESTPRASANGVEGARSRTSLRKEARVGESEVSSMPGAFPEELDRKSTPTSGYRRTVSTGSQPTSSVTQDTNTDSDATSVPENHKAPRPANTPPLATDSPIAQAVSEFPNPPLPSRPGKPPTPAIDVNLANLNSPQSFGLTPMTALPPPPPPPPPMDAAKTVPRVDYLLKNGGLLSMVPKRLVSGAAPPHHYNFYQSPPLLQQPPLEEYAKIFSALHKRLDDYLHVLRKNGSLAVATGYKSVARRLLDKLSQVFARDISSVRCDCAICKATPQMELSDEEDSGISWGEILEFVSGRRELPPWPPFSIQPDGNNGLGISTSAAQAPMQKLDIDVPAEYRDHYIRQNQKTKRAVQNWLEQQPDFPSSPPEDADEDTLMFAMMTKLNTEQRNYFIALMHGQSTVSATRAPTPAQRPMTSSIALKRARKALTRLYRLDRTPRDCESAMYLLNNPQLHGMLATLAEVNEQEWEILVSGRFDGFLWSGAEAPFPPSASQFNSPFVSRGPSRNANATPLSRHTTPFSGLSGMPSAQNSRTSTPFSPLPSSTSADSAEKTPQQTKPVFPARSADSGSNRVSPVGGPSPPAPVQLDEDTEIAVLAEIERNLFNDMERFEDAFEILHSRAEMVRQSLRERSAGLSLQAQLRRGGGASPGDDAFVRLDTPASGVTDIEDDDDDGLGDAASLAPDDSASQVSARKGRRSRREGKRSATLPERVVEEEMEEGSTFEEDMGRGRKEGGRRSRH